MDNAAATGTSSRPPVRWLNRTVVGIGLASLFCDWSNEMATTALPAFLSTIGVAAAWLGVIEGVSNGLASFAKLASGFYTDKLERRKPVAVAGYLITALGTASFALAASAWQILVGRSFAALGRGVRTPVRKALMAGSVTPETYGRAFGLERMMDTTGAIIGPACALVLLYEFNGSYAPLFALTLIPGLAAAAVVAFVVKERARPRVAHLSLSERLRSLPAACRKMLLAVGVFGMGAFAHTMLILLATEKLTPAHGTVNAASIAVALYILHNVVYAALAPVGGWLGDRLPKMYLLGFGYLMAAAMSLCIIIAPANIAVLAVVFILAGTNAALEETMEDALCAELAPAEHHGTAFGAMAMVNGVGDFFSSLIVGLLWSRFGPKIAFGYSAALSLAAAFLVFQLCREHTQLE